MPDLTERLTRLETLVAAPPGGGPAHRIASDYASGGSGKKKSGGSGSGRHVASKAGEKRYGLPIGTPLGGTNSKAKGDKGTQRSYAMFQSAKTPADMRANARWMSNDDLGKAAEALFSFSSKNERDEAARLVLVRELADRGVNPAQFGYKGGPIAINPNPKKDPTLRARETVDKQAESERKTAERTAESDRKAAERESAKKVREAETKATQVARDAAAHSQQILKNSRDAEDLKARTQAGEALARGDLSEQELRARWQARRKRQPTG